MSRANQLNSIWHGNIPLFDDAPCSSLPAEPEGASMPSWPLALLRVGSIRPPPIASDVLRRTAELYRIGRCAVPYAMRGPGQLSPSSSRGCARSREARPDQGGDSAQLSHRLWPVWAKAYRIGSPPGTNSVCFREGCPRSARGSGADAWATAPGMMGSRIFEGYFFE